MYLKKFWHINESNNYVFLRFMSKQTEWTDHFDGFHTHNYAQLRLLTASLILAGSAMFGTTFNLVTRVGLPLFLEQ